MTNVKADAVRVQTSILNALEKKVLVWLAERQPKWITSDILTFIGTFGAVVVAAGYVLTSVSVNFLWLSSIGFVINWYGDSLDGTLARVRNVQRPVYGYYLDHTMDCINEFIMLVGVGLSGLIHFELAMLILAVYFMLTVNVSINAHLKREFRLTYAKLGPTEFRILAVIVNTVLATVPPITDFSVSSVIFGHQLTLSAMDIAGIIVLICLLVIYFVTIIGDAREYAKNDPMPGK